VPPKDPVTPQRACRGTVQTRAGCRLCRAVVEAASRFGRFFAGQMTAAGRVPPAKARAGAAPAALRPLRWHRV